MWEMGWVKIWTIWTCSVGGEGKRRGTYRGNDATEDKTKAIYVGIAVGVVLHSRWGGVVRDVLRLVG